MIDEAIQVKGARVNNLKNVSFSIPLNQMTVVTGVSGGVGGQRVPELAFSASRVLLRGQIRHGGACGGVVIPVVVVG